MINIEIFTGPGCSYCTAAKNLLKARNLPFVDHDVSGPEVLQELRRRVPHARTVPQIFAGDEHVGGFDDLSHRLSGH
ncbi:glutaredoxin 3 [Mesorhizobium tianshanense]|uniref:Glutaredoxin 3 n=1 Tax=Mesorhizobium tianshanense TaxID=39844 RepID=A0A562P394_9HYPH|nr:glutaredoxin domain-containing protein [Mesorhizobium tianshanense]TWI38811.1 glutaredoxin 3 [Mesorhizobium tianshanense]GLS38157.1 glutaredoxin 3 [Mesorhizobium tianshanense]